MIKHPERVSRVVGGRTVETDGYFTLEVDYVTEGGVAKTLTLAHIDADALRVALVSQFENMEPEERKRSFFASGRRKR
jgi:hypothetical protein